MPLQAKEQARPHVDHWAHEFQNANTDDLERVWKESTRVWPCAALSLPWHCANR